ncbi:MAG: T9SS type A sorting domain-containing protein [Saprospiraceae bacterium]
MKSVTALLFTIFSLTSSFGQFWTLDVSFGLDTYDIQARNDTIIVGGPSILVISYDNGNSWNSITDGLPQWPSVRGVLWTGNKLFVSVHTHGLYVSNDLGQTWQVFDNTVIPNDSPYHLATTEGYLFISDGNGFLWRSPLDSPILVNVLTVNGGVEEMAVSGNGDLYVSTSGTGVYHTADLGNSWTTLNNGLPAIPNSFYYAVQTIAVNEQGDLYCGVNYNGVYKYDFTASTWVAKNEGIEEVANGVGTQYKGLFVAGHIVLIGTEAGNVYLSTDKAQSFTNISVGEFVPTSDIALSSSYIFVARVGVRKRLYDGLFNLTAVAPQPLAARIALFPNPTTGNLTLNASRPLQNCEIVVSDYSGRTVKTLKASGTSTVDLDLSAMPPGIYFVLLAMNDKVLVREKVIKLDESGR